MGMAFTDTLVTETDARWCWSTGAMRPVGIGDRAYPFVRLHQPSAYYGVNSRGLGSDTIDRVGWNEGLYELATVGEVCAYFDQVMRQDLLPSGRVSYFPMAEYLGEGRFHTLAGGDHAVDVRRRIVDATYLKTVVPSMRPPPIDVGDGVDCVAPNDIPASAAGHQRFVIVGAGKTGIDACLWLLCNGIQPRAADVDHAARRLADGSGQRPTRPAIPGAVSGRFPHPSDRDRGRHRLEDLFERLEACGNLLRLDSSVRPSMYRCANVSRAELQQLQRIGDIVRMGRVERIEPGKIVLADGGDHPPTIRRSTSTAAPTDWKGARRQRFSMATGSRCRACAAASRCSAPRLIAHVEAGYHDDAKRNDLCAPVPHPNTDLDWLTTTHRRATQPDPLARRHRPDGMALRGKAGSHAAHVCPADGQTVRYATKCSG